MKKTMTTVPFNGTAEQKAALDALIAAHKGEAGALMPVLQQAQDIYGYLPVEVQKEIAAGLDVPYSEVFGVVTFYSQFLLNPKGAHPVAVCLGTACYVKGSGKLMEKLEELLKIKPGEISDDLQFSLDATRCIGACGIAPAVTINGKVYPKVTVDMVPGIVEEYRAAAQ